MPAASSKISRRWALLALTISAIFPWPMTEYPSRLRPVSRNSSVTSRRRTTLLLILYSLSPLRYSLRETTTSFSWMGRLRSLLSMVRETLAKPWAFRFWVPPKMTSSILDPRSTLLDCSPNTQRTPSLMLLFPLPLGPTMAVIPSSKVSLVRSGKDLKPCSSMARSRIAVFLLS